MLENGVSSYKAWRKCTVLICHNSETHYPLNRQQLRNSNNQRPNFLIKWCYADFGFKKIFLFLFQLIPVTCDKCHKNFCIRHRNELDHDCRGFQGTGRQVSKPGWDKLQYFLLLLVICFSCHPDWYLNGPGWFCIKKRVFLPSLPNSDHEGMQRMSDVSLLSGMSGLSFDSSSSFLCSCGSFSVSVCVMFFFW